LSALVDFAHYAVGHAGPDELGFAEVVAPINALRVVVLEQDTAYEPYSVRETREEAIGAEVKHGMNQKRRPIGSPLHRQRR